MKKKSKIDWLNHFFGLISVLLGVLIAFGLNSWNENNKEDKIISTVLKNLYSEVEGNIRKVDSVNQENQVVHDQLKEYLELVDSQMEPLEPIDSLRAFQSRNTEFISDDLESIAFHIELYQLSNVAWKTAERTNILSAMDYDLVKGLAVIYDFQTKIERFDVDITDRVASIATSENRKEDWARIRKDIDIALQFSTSLQEGYKDLLQEIKAYRD